VATERQYMICDELAERHHAHCAALVITGCLTRDRAGLLWPSSPSAAVRNGTLTFVESKGRAYGISCWHVIEYLHTTEKQGGDVPYSLATMVNGFHFVLDRFIRPHPPFGEPELDIAIREVKVEFPRGIGKIPLNLDTVPAPPECIDFGYAVGFPEHLKHEIKDDIGSRISMPHAAVLAELSRKPDGRFSLFSNLQDGHGCLSFSGMSGGPIFWSAADRYGILGIIRATGSGSEIFGDKALQISGELATPDRIREWIKQCDGVPQACVTP